MKKVLFLLAFTAMTGIASAAVISNGSFESYADDGYGRLMPTGFGLWTPDWGTVGPDAHVVTTDARTGLASMQMGTDGGDVALTYGLGILPVGNYTVSGYVKGAGALGHLGVDMFAPDWSGYWWGGGADISGSTANDWTKFSFDITVSTDAQWNFVVKGYAGTADFLVDDVAIVPEPATLVLLGLGGLLLRRRK